MTKATPPLPPDDLDELVDEPEPAATEESAPATPPEPPAEEGAPEPSSPPPPVPPAAPAIAAGTPPAAPPPYYHHPMEKSPGLALFLSIFFPGLGHIYAASYERALMIVTGIGLCVAAIGFTEGRLWPLGFVIAFGYFFSIFDAYRETQVANLVAADQELPKPHRHGEGRLIFGVFLSVLALMVLADNLGLFDITWFYDWWPVLILIVGLYFIGSWIWEKMKAASGTDTDDFD